MKYIIDRFEGKWTVCEDENCKMVDIEKSKLPKAFASAMSLCMTLIKIKNSSNKSYARNKSFLRISVAT